MGDWVIGIDLGGTKTALGLISPDDRIVASRRMPTAADEGPQAVVERIARLVAELETELPAGETISAIGICCPGPLNHITGTLGTLVNVRGLSNVPIRQLLVDRLKLPVRLEHDAKAAALGDFFYGSGRGRNSMVYVVIGTGVGGAVIIDGQVQYGESNTAGEVGHMTVNPHGEQCHCGTRGCLEVYTSGPNLERRYREALAGAGNSDETHQHVSGETIARLAAQSDPIASKIMDEAGQALGIAVASMAMILNIETYVIGGSVVKSGDVLLEPARKTVHKFCFKAVSPRIRIVASELGDDGPILGCAWLARHSAVSA